MSGRNGRRTETGRRGPLSFPVPMIARFLCLAVLVGLAGCDLDRAAPSDASAAPSARRSSGEPSPEAVDAFVGGEGLRLRLPTTNRALLTDRPDRFYQGLNVTIDSLRPERWEGGQYGFVRDPVPTIFGRRTFRRVHEGLDIRPVGRDDAGEPIDTVMAIAPGRVAYVNPSAGASSYGKYIVVEHTWSGSSVYSLYAHLAETFVTEGTRVEASDALGKMGYTGRGLGRARAHVHLEIALMLNQYQPLWFERYIGAADLHGRFFGTNLSGVPAADLYLALRETPDLTFPEFVTGLDEGYVIDLPGRQPLDLLRRYPWLGPEVADVDPADVPAWRVAFTQEGLPIRVEVGDEEVDRATVEGVSLGIWLGDRSTNRMLLRRGFGYEPSRRGYNYFALISTTADGPPLW